MQLTCWQDKRHIVCRKRKSRPKYKLNLWRMSDFGLKVGQIDTKWENLGLFKISTFWLKPNFKSRICPILCQSDPLHAQIWHPCLSADDCDYHLLIHHTHWYTHIFFTFQSNAGNYYQWWFTFIMFVLDFSFEMLHFKNRGLQFTCTSMDN